jgi:hypothetical protein
MNPMYDFTKSEIGLIHMGLFAIAQSTKEAMEESELEPPDGFVETLESVINKINEVIEARIANQDQFESLITSLTDVENKSQSVISNPETPINEYN